MCYDELLDKGSCRHGNNCRFDHNFPEKLREDNYLMEKVSKQRRETTKCVNEYRRKDSCQKGTRCRFNHNITDDERKDPALQKFMEKKREMIYQQSKKEFGSRSEETDETNAKINQQRIVKDALKDMEKAITSLITKMCP